jgi:hypothetical protein
MKIIFVSEPNKDEITIYRPDFNSKKSRLTFREAHRNNLNENETKFVNGIKEALNNLDFSLIDFIPEVEDVLTIYSKENFKNGETFRYKESKWNYEFVCLVKLNYNSQFVKKHNINIVYE